MSGIFKGVVIVAAKRTPFGTYGGKFLKTDITELQAVATKAALTAGNIKPELVDTVNIGCVIANSRFDGMLIARHAALKSGIPQDKPALHVNRLCGTGFQTIVNGAQDIVTGAANISVTGGVDNMTQAPHVVRNLRFGLPLGTSPQIEDSLWLGLTDSYCNMAMAQTAEKLGAQMNVTKDEVNEFSYRSQLNWKIAQEGGRFNDELAPVEVKIKGKAETVQIDEHPRPKTTLEGLQKLPSLFKENGLVTAGTASGICDGAGTVILASDDATKQHNLTPLARVHAYATVGVDPTIMGIGPVPAIRKVLELTGKTFNDIDLIEINEAFAAQTLACAKQLNLDMNKLNVNGGAIALGHPLAASGSRITAHLVHELRRRKAKFGIGSACIGGGQGIALLIEALY